MGTCDFISGWTGGVLGLVTGHPFDSVKVNQQNRGTGMLECIKQIFLNHGIKGYFRGMTFPIIAASSINSIYFGVYRVSLERIMELGNEDRLFRFEADHQWKNQNTTSKGKHRYPDTFIAGCIGGTAQLILTVPVELVKIKLQTTPTPSTLNTVKYRGPLDVVRHILKSKGPQGLYHGMGITMLRDVPSSGVYMCGYAALSDLLQEFDFLKDGSVDGAPNAMRVLIAGGLAGMISWWSIIPIDVVKSRIQADDPLNPRFKGLIDCSQQIFRKHGYKGFLRGALPLTLRAFPVNAVTFLGYEWTNSLCGTLTTRDYF